MSQEQANSMPPPSANPSTIASVGLLASHTTSQMFRSLKMLQMAELSLPTNSEMSAPAANACGFLRFPSSGSGGGAPAMTMTL